MKITDKDEIIDRMMKGSETINKNRNKSMKSFRRKNKDGKVSKSYKNRLGKHLNKSLANLEVGEKEDATKRS
jgi:hypothetical protein